MEEAALDRFPRDIWRMFATWLDLPTFLNFKQASRVFYNDPNINAQFLTRQWIFWFEKGEKHFLGETANSAKILLKHCAEMPVDENREEALVRIFNQLLGATPIPLNVNADPVLASILRLKKLSRGGDSYLSENAEKLHFDVVYRAMQLLIENDKPSISLSKMIESEKSVNRYLDYAKRASAGYVVAVLPAVGAILRYTDAPELALVTVAVGLMLGRVINPRDFKTNGFVQRQCRGHGSFWKHIEAKKETGSEELKLLASCKPYLFSPVGGYKTVILLLILWGIFSVMKLYSLNHSPERINFNKSFKRG